MGHRNENAQVLPYIKLALRLASKQKDTLSSHLKRVAIALCVFCLCSCASKLPRQTAEHHVHVADHTPVGGAMITVEDVTFKEGKRRACLFWGGAPFKEPTSAAFREGLFYEGMSGNTIKMTHREYRGDLTTPSWITPLEHDLSVSPVFWFLDFRVRVIEATKEAIHFTEISRPRYNGTPLYGPYVMNIDARINDRSFPIKLLLAAGSYTIQPISIVNGGRYNGWKSGSGSATWFNRYCVESDEFYFCEGANVGFASDRLAYENAKTRVFVLREKQHVYFFVAADAHADNAGGVSLRLEPAFAPDIYVFGLSPDRGSFGTNIHITGNGFGRKQSGMLGPQEGYYSFVELRRKNDSQNAVITKYPFWADGEITVILQDLFFDLNGDGVKNGDDVMVGADGLGSGKYYVTVHTVWFRDENNNGIYDGRHEQHYVFSGDAQVFELISVEPDSNARACLSFR